MGNSACWSGPGTKACGEGFWAGTEALGLQHGAPRCFGGPGVRGWLESSASLVLSIFPFGVTDISAARENGRSLPSETKLEFTMRVPKGLQAGESNFRSRVRGLPFMSLSERKASCVMRAGVRNTYLCRRCERARRQGRSF